MTYEFIRYDREGALAILTINRPEVYNALHPPAHDELHHALDAFAADPELFVAIVTGAGDKAFCAGFDLKWQASGQEVRMPPTSFGGIAKRDDLFKPVIAAVNGLAMGGGFEMVLACDLVIAAENAQFALPEPRVGIAALAGERLGANDADPRQQNQQHRQLKRDAECQDHGYDRRQVLAHARLKLDRQRALVGGGLEPQQELPGERHDDVIDQRGARNEQHRARDQERQDGGLFVLVKAGRHELPHLRREDRERDNKSRE